MESGDIPPEFSLDWLVDDAERGWQSWPLAELIRSRRSVRRYQARPISHSTLQRLVETACWAPSPHNRQPWRFGLITEPVVKASLAEKMGARLRGDLLRDGAPEEAIEADVLRSRQRIVGAPALILVCLSMAEMDTYSDDARESCEHLMAVQATAAATQTLLLLAHSIGLSACWMCAPLFCPEVVRNALSLPCDWQPQALLTIGVAAAPGRVRDRRPVDRTIMWLTGRGPTDE
jgi:coenzyme F420-0:L-glutamate ligase/coenzyme F420-1:gamma-L-glutamate ligase